MASHPWTFPFVLKVYHPLKVEVDEHIYLPLLRCLLTKRLYFTHIAVEDVAWAQCTLPE